jgi:hypothetical protein
VSEWVRCWGGELRQDSDLDAIRDWYDAGNSMGGEAGTVVGPNPTHVTEVGE